MRFARCVLLLLVLLAGSLSPPTARAQDSRSPPPATEQGFYLEQNYPNPVNPETWIPFQLEEELFRSSDSVVVTLRIYNILGQVVAIPLAADPPMPQRTRVFNLAYDQPGRKVAYWDGKDSAGRRIASGVYYCQLVVDDQPRTSMLKMTVLNPSRRRRLFPG